MSITISRRILEFTEGNYVLRNFAKGLRLMLSDRSAKIYFLIILFVLSLGLIGPSVAPYEFDQTLRDENGDVKRLESPSVSHPLGTTDLGYDVLSRLLYGAQPTVISGLLGGALIISIGLTVGLTSGYMGGRTDSLLMRFTDLVYGVPLIPFAIVLTAFFGIGFLQSILVIGLVLWRGSARVIRAQVLQIKERPFILAARATGSSRPRIIIKHILPNVASMAILFFALGIGYTIIIQASLSFIGVSSPFVPSWGVMVRNAYKSGYMSAAWWWSLPPGLLIAFTVMATFMFGRTYERISGQTDGSLAQMG
jgi:peptide/nickel transport system permease protein